MLVLRVGSSSHFIVSLTACAPKVLRFGRVKTRSLSHSVLTELRCSSLPFSPPLRYRGRPCPATVPQSCHYPAVSLSLGSPFSPFLHPGVSAERDHTPFVRTPSRRLRLLPFCPFFPFNPAYPPSVTRHRSCRNSSGVCASRFPFVCLLFSIGCYPRFPFCFFFVSRVRDL